MLKAILTFDVEEFDVPLEYGQQITMEEQIEVSTRGTLLLKALLDKHQVKSTIFCTGQYALSQPELMKTLAEKHEIASHGMYHSSFDAKIDLPASKKLLSQITGQSVEGFRMARMMPVENQDIADAGYVYNASLNPTFLPGRYNHLDKPKLPFVQDRLWQIPATVTPNLRFPMFWLSFKNLPFSVYKMFSNSALNRYGIINLYFHPWEFTDLSAYTTIPAYVRKHSDRVLLQRLDDYITWLKAKGVTFITMKEYVEELKLKSNTI